MPAEGALDRVLAENDRLAGEGLRVLAVATRDIEPSSFDAGGDLLAEVQDVTLLALVGIVDPPRKEARDAIALCKDAGIQVRMITGDHATTAAAIGGQLGIEGRALTGTEFAALSDEELDAQVGEIGVVARVAPEDKVRLVDMLKRKGNVVAMTGDGVNDAPALKRSDIGVAMGITGTEVTKEAADMILTDDNFATIVSAVEGGRGIYDNLMKYVRIQLIELGAFILLFVLAGAFDVANGAPLTPLQVLWINFAIDVVLAIGLGFDAAVPGLMKRRPRDASAPIVNRSLAIRLGSLALVMAVIALGVVAWGEDRYDLAIATTMGLTTLSLMHIVAALEVREPTQTHLQPLHAREPAVRAADRSDARADLPRDGAELPAAHLRHGFLDELAVGHLPARADRLPRDRGAREALRPAQPPTGPSRPGPASRWPGRNGSSSS